MLSQIAEHSAAAKGLPLYQIILIGVGVFLGVALISNLIQWLFIRHRQSVPEASPLLSPGLQLAEQPPSLNSTSNIQSEALQDVTKQLEQANRQLQEREVAANQKEEEISQLSKTVKSLESQLDEVIRHRLTFEIHEQGSYVTMSGGTEVRRIQAVVNMRFSNADTLSIPVSEINATLHKQGLTDTPEEIKERVAILRDPVSGLTISSTQTLSVVPSCITEWRQSVFCLDVAPDLEDRLCRDHFIRITMKSPRQADFWQDFYVVDWRVTQGQNSLIQLRNDET